MICHQCNRDNTKICNRDRVYRQGTEILIVEQVPSISCQECGQVFYDADTLVHLQHIKDNKEKLASDRNVKIISFNTVVAPN